MKNFHSFHWVNKLAFWIGLVFAVFWVFLFVMGAIIQKEQITSEGLILVLFIFLIILSFIVAIRHKKWGGVLLVIFSSTFCIFSYIAAGRNKLMAALISGAPFIISGILFLIGHQLEQHN